MCAVRKSTLDFDHVCSKKFGEIRGSLLRQWTSVPAVDLMIGSVALVHDLTLVTHNTADLTILRMRTKKPPASSRGLSCSSNRVQLTG